MYLILLSVLFLVFPFKSYSSELIGSLSKEDLEAKVLDLNPQYTISTFRKAIRIKNKEFIKSDEVEIFYCDYKVQYGDILIDILRKFGYRRPWSLGLVEYVKVVTGIKLERKLRSSSWIKVPIPIKRNSLNGSMSCEEVLQNHKEKPLIIQGPEAMIRDNHLCPGLTLRELKKNISVKQKCLLEDEEVSKKDFFGVGQRSLSKTSLTTDVSFGYSSIDATEKSDSSQASIISTLYPRFSLSWNHSWNSKWSSFLRGVYHLASFEESQSSSSGKNFSATTQPTLSLSLGGRRSWSKLSYIEFSLGSKEIVLIESESTTNVTLLKDRMPSGLLELGLSLRSGGFVNWGSIAQVEYLGGGSHDSLGLDKGFGFGLGLQAYKKFKQSGLRSRLFWKRYEEDTKTLDQVRKDLSIGMSYIFSY